MNNQIERLIDDFRANPSDNGMHNLIEMGTDALPLIVAAWLDEDNVSIRNNFFWVLSEMPSKETVPLFLQKLSSSDHEELRSAVLGLLRFDALKYETQILTAIKSHPTMSKEKPFIDHVEVGLKAAKQRRSVS